MKCNYDKIRIITKERSEDVTVDVIPYEGEGWEVIDMIVKKKRITYILGRDDDWNEPCPPPPPERVEYEPTLREAFKRLLG